MTPSHYTHPRGIVLLSNTRGHVFVRVFISCWRTYPNKQWWPLALVCVAQWFELWIVVTAAFHPLLVSLMCDVININSDKRRWVNILTVTTDCIQKMGKAAIGLWSPIFNTSLEHLETGTEEPGVDLTHTEGHLEVHKILFWLPQPVSSTSDETESLKAFLPVFRAGSTDTEVSSYIFTPSADHWNCTFQIRKILQSYNRAAGILYQGRFLTQRFMWCDAVNRVLLKEERMPHSAKTWPCSKCLNFTAIRFRPFFNGIFSEL